MPFNPYASPQAQDASRMPQTGFGQSNPSPQYGGVPNQNAFQNANPAANLSLRFGQPSEGAALPLPGAAPTPSQALGVPFGGRPTPQNYGGPMFGNTQPAPTQVGFEPWLGGGPYQQRPGMFRMFNEFNQISPFFDMIRRFYEMRRQFAPNALANQPNTNYLAPPR